MRYVLRRIVHAALLLIAASALSFVFASLAPGDFYTEMSMDPRVSADTVARLRTQQGFNQPIAIRYMEWARNAMRGDFGYSMMYRAPVGALLWPRMRATLLLASVATFAAWCVAIPLGVWSAASCRRAGRARWLTRGLKVVLAFLLAIPDLLLAVVLTALAARGGWLPVGGMASANAASLGLMRQSADLARHLLLPAAVLGLGMLPIVARHVHAGVVEAIESPFALHARALGIPARRLLFRHVLPAAMNPLLALLGLSIGTLLSASLLIEIVMGWPGLGPLFLGAILARDFTVVLAVVMLSAVFVVGGNLASDLLLYRFDPRIRAERT
jgi:peptide/nickel transport system permease protein